MDTMCNGFTNYATWMVKHQFMSDDDHIREMAKECNNAHDLSKKIEQYVFDSFDEYDLQHNHNPFMDYAYEFLQFVNWTEIGEACWNEINENNEE